MGDRNIPAPDRPRGKKHGVGCAAVRVENISVNNISVTSRPLFSCGPKSTLRRLAHRSRGTVEADFGQLEPPATFGEDVVRAGGADAGHSQGAYFKQAVEVADATFAKGF